MADLTMHLPGLSTTAEGVTASTDSSESSSCRIVTGDASHTYDASHNYWVSIRVVRYLAHNGVSGAARARKRLGGMDNGGIHGVESVGIGENTSAITGEVREGNVCLVIEYGAPPKQGESGVDYEQHRDGVRRIIEDAAVALQSYRGA